MEVSHGKMQVPEFLDTTQKSYNDKESVHTNNNSNIWCR